MAGNSDVVDSLALNIDISVRGESELENFHKMVSSLTIVLENCNEVLTEFIHNLGLANANNLQGIVSQIGGATTSIPTQDSGITPTAGGMVEDAQDMAEAMDEAAESTEVVSQKVDDTNSRMSSLKSKAESLAKSFKGLGRNIGNSFGKAMNGIRSALSSFTRILKYRIIRNIIRTVAEGFTTGVQNLARYSSQFNDTMSKFVNTTAYLKNALGTLSQPLLELVLPAVETVINALVTAINKINELIAKVKGEGTYTAAVMATKGSKNWIDYADSLDSANKSAKKLKNTLLGFDELNVLSDNSSSSSAAGSDYASMFEERQVALGNDTLAGKLALQFQDVFMNWDDLTGEDIAEKVFTGLCALTGAATGFVLGGVPGAIIGTLVGTAIGLLATSVFFDDNGKIDAHEIVDMILAGLGLVSGAVIGAVTIGTVSGGVIGASIGLAIGLGLGWANEKIINSSISTEEIQKVLDDIGDMLVGALVALGIAAAFVASGGVLTIPIAGALSLAGVTMAMLKPFSNIKELFTTMVEQAQMGWNNGWSKWEIDEENDGTVKKFFKRLVGAVMAILGIHSPSTVFRDIGDNVVQGFMNGITEKWENLKGDVSDKLDNMKAKFTEFSTNVKNTVTNAFSAARDGAVNKLNDMKDTVDRVKNGIESGVRSFVNNILSGIEWLVNKVLYGLNWLLVKAKNIINTLPESVRNALNLDRILTAQVSYVSLPRYAQGGFPEDGVFMANHGELVGKFSNGKTAVANNEQITNGIYKAVLQAMNESANGGNGTTTFVAQLNGKTLFEEVVRQNNTATKSYGSSPLSAF